MARNHLKEASVPAADRPPRRTTGKQRLDRKYAQAE
jgi:hypothetical protein